MILMANILTLHGPNLNLLGQREPDVYGSDTLESINNGLKQKAKELGHNLLITQSNAEHELINQVQHARDSAVHFIIINPAGLTHTSVSLRDAFAAAAKEHHSKVKDLHKQLKDASDEDKDGLREQLKGLRKDWFEGMKGNREEVRNRIKEIRNEFKNKRDEVIDGNNPGE